ncbi:DNA polymerase [Thermosyntropha lipolytica DSM 11003]|uniref:Type-4 uracil-DNA glycosylase n=1 Tax=Thermosyntropha lipolytica DSM 11003 TaxID=1123382 RepID=A0A1M5JEQ8_9FIRM|nr:uracil-DNA glycosylase [Thermosyntropha lipolytica]SHG39062.1 DNA polymerase [Thermosyntropha lipolytica DSM 11003]
MEIKQPDLFAGLFPEIEKEEAGDISRGEPVLPFLEGVRLEEAYPHIDDLDELKKTALSCQSCRLRAGCKQVVFGEGPSKSRIMFVGEGPGGDEDEQGRPFVGRAGQLLDKILKAAEIPREQAYITNVVKCRPPGNRLPNPDEVNSCKGYLEAQIRIIKPDIIVCLGSLASQVIISPKARITQIRGKWFTRQGIMIMPTFHPAALLRNESYKRPCWEDFKMIRDQFKKIKEG